MIWYIVAFAAGAFVMAKTYFFLFGRFIKRGWQLEHVLKGLSPDQFNHLRKGVDAETNRRNTLL